MDAGFNETGAHMGFTESPPTEDLTIRLKKTGAPPVDGDLTVAVGAQSVDPEDTGKKTEDTGKKTDNVGDIYGEKIIGYEKGREPLNAIKLMVAKKLKIDVKDVTMDMISKIDCRPRLDNSGNPVVTTWVPEKWDDAKKEFTGEPDITKMIDDDGTVIGYKVTEFACYHIEIDIHVPGQDEPVKMTYVSLGSQVMPEGQEANHAAIKEFDPYYRAPPSPKNPNSHEMKALFARDELKLKVMMNALTLACDKDNKSLEEALARDGKTLNDLNPGELEEYNASKQDYIDHLGMHMGFQVSEERDGETTRNLVKGAAQFLGYTLLAASFIFIPTSFINDENPLLVENIEAAAMEWIDNKLDSISSGPQFNLKNFTWSVETLSNQVGQPNQTKHFKGSVARTHAAGMNALALISGGNFSALATLDPHTPQKQRVLYRGQIKNDPRKNDRDFKHLAENSDEVRLSQLTNAQQTRDMNALMANKTWGGSASLPDSVQVDEYVQGLKKSSEKDVFNFNVLAKAILPPSSYWANEGLAVGRENLKKQLETPNFMDKAKMRLHIRNQGQIVTELNHKTGVIAAALTDMKSAQNEIRAKLDQLQGMLDDDKVDQNLKNAHIIPLYNSLCGHLHANNEQMVRIQEELKKVGFPSAKIPKLNNENDAKNYKTIEFPLETDNTDEEEEEPHEVD